MARQLDLSRAPKRVIRGLAGIALCLSLASLAGECATYLFGHDTIRGLVPYFSLRMEGNLPTWYASSTLLLGSMLCGVIGLGRRRMRSTHVRHWLALSLIFAFLSVDEATGLHESLNGPLRTAYHTGGWLYFPWVVPGAAFVAVVALGFRRFLAALPAGTRRRFVAAGAVYVWGALAMEVLQARHYALHGPGWRYALIWTLGEILEMTGVLIFLHALMRYLVRHPEEVRSCFGHDDGTAGPAGPPQARAEP